MKIRINYTVEVKDNYRMALAHHYGLNRPATRDELKNHFRDNGTSLDEDLLYEYEQHLQATTKGAK